jgi:amidohydrolase
VDAKQRAERRFSEVEQELRDLSRWMYEHPEIAYEERETSARLTEFLAGKGFRVEYPAYGLETAFAARTGTSGPEVIVCAEMDALPGVGHACGHNVIATAALGAGVALAELTEELGFRVTILGTPAEEKIGGKVDLIEAGAFDGAAAAMMIHPAPEDTVDPFVLAVHHLVVEFRGKDAHAAAAPWEGRNALDAFVQAYNGIAMLRQHFLPTDKMHCIITHGGDAPNIIPSYTRSEWYVRAATKERLEDLMGRFRDTMEAAAGATGCTVEIGPEGYEYHDLVSDPVMVDLFQANAAAMGRTMLRAADRNNAASGSTDMGNVSHVVPTIHPMIGMDTKGAVNHQPEFAAHTVTPDGERAMRDGALAMAWTVIDVASDDRWDELGSTGE